MKAMFRSALLVSAIVLTGSRFTVEARQSAPVAKPTFYSSGAKKGEGATVDGKYHGRFIGYFENGKIKYDVQFVNGFLVGPWTEYFANGQIRTQGEAYGNRDYYHNEPDYPLKTGVWTTWFENGQKESVGTYAADLMSGKWVEYFQTGTVHREVHLQKGKLMGPWTEFYPNGQIREQGNADGSEQYYHNEFRHPWKTGVWTVWFENGQKKFVGAYSNNNCDGRWIEYEITGFVRRDVNFVNGQLKGMWLENYPSGRPKLQGEAYGSELINLNDLDKPLKTGVWITFDQNGNVLDATIYVQDKPVGKASLMSDDTTGITWVRYNKADGSQAVFQVDKKGWKTPEPKQAPKPGQPVQHDEATGALLASSTDPATGEITTLRRNADGSVSTFRGTRTVEADKTERLIETDQAGRRIETVIAPDGTVTMTHSVNGKNETRTVTHPNGQLETTQRDSKGNTRTTKLNESGSLILERRNAEGKLIETVTNRPDGWREHVDSEGNVRREFEAEDGSTTIIAVDRSGNTTTTVRDAKGVEVSREVKQIGPREPGRAYFEDVLGGKDWHLVPQATRDRHANTERQALERAANRAKEAAVAARRKADDAGRAAQADALSQQRQIEWEKFKAEQAAAEKKAAALETVYQRRDAIDDAYAKGKELQRQFDEALKRGDKAEAARIMERHDRHSEEVSRLLLNSPEEAAAIKADSDERYRVASRINAQARQAAAATIAQDEKIQDAKEAATGKAQYLLTGSWMQEQTKATTRAANRERAEAVAALDLIERELKDPAISDSERDILRDQRVIAEVKKAGADAILADNGRLTAIAYGLDGLTTLSGTKAAVLVGGALIKKTVGAVGSTLAKRAAATEAAGIAGKTTVSVVDDVGIASAKSIVGRNARVEGEITRIVGSDLLPVPPQPQAPLAVTQSELTRLFTPGNNLTGAEILKKVEFLRLMHEARITLQQASLRGAPDSVVAPLRNEYERLQGLVNEIMRARP